MPMKWVEPEVFLVHKNKRRQSVTIFHAYKDGFRMCYWYAIDDGQPDGAEFDIRVLPEWKLSKDLPEFKHKDILKQAIESGSLDKVFE